MWMVETGIELLALLILGRYLWRKHCERIGWKYQAQELHNWRVSGFDASPLRPRLEIVRKEYTAALGCRHSDTTFKPKLISLARNLVSGLAYFRDRNSRETERGSAADQQA